MANGTRVRDWATVDYYALLGIEPTADADEVTRAFREQAKRSHPDATDDEAAAERFSDVAAAYAVLGDRGTRREYDRVRAEQRGVVAQPAAAPVATAPTVRRKPRKPWSRRRCITVFIIGMLCAMLGVGASLLTWTMHENSAHQRARFVPVTAYRTAGAGMVTFLTRSGERLLVPEPQQHGDPNGTGTTVNIRYDPANPRHVIVDSGTMGRDITFAIVSLKLFVGGLFLAGMSLKRLRAAR
jgi:DnaJ domain